MSQQQQQSRGLTQSKEALLKSYTMRLKDDIKAMLDNFTEVIKLARVNKNKDGHIIKKNCYSIISSPEP